MPPEQLRERRNSFWHQQGRPLPLNGLDHVGWTRLEAAKPQALGPHQHEGAYEICLIRRGCLRWWVGDESHAVEPGHLFMTRPDEIHGGEHDVLDPCEIYWVSFVLDTQQGSLGLSAEEARLIDDALRQAPQRVCRCDEELLAHHYERLLDALRLPGPLSPLVLRATMALLLRDVITAYERSRSDEQRFSVRTKEAIAWMRANLHQACPMTTVAARVELRPSRFRELFRADTGYTPQDYLNRLRIDRAKDMLRESDRAIIDIALACGFSSSQYFATVFRRLTGLSPRAFRNSTREVR